MKVRLTKIQSAELIRQLGDIKYCSDYIKDFIVDTDGENEFHEIKHWIFTLEDLLAIVPKYYMEGNVMRYLDMQYMGNFIETDFHHKWNVGYTREKGIRHHNEIDRFCLRYSTYSEELIDALYEMILKIIENGYKDMLKL